MTTPTQPLRDEHRELYPHVEQLRKAAETLEGANPVTVRAAVDEAHEFLAYHLLPHAQAEEAALYPAVQAALGSPQATGTMSRDHVEVGSYIEELAALKSKLDGKPLPADQIRELRRVLYGVYAVVKVHFAKEEEVYLPILDKKLTPESSRELFRKMEAAAHEARQAVAV